jgi:hypothetical protein
MSLGNMIERFWIFILNDPKRRNVSDDLACLGDPAVRADSIGRYGRLFGIARAGRWPEVEYNQFSDSIDIT